MYPYDRNNGGSTPPSNPYYRSTKPLQHDHSELMRLQSKREQQNYHRGDDDQSSFNFDTPTTAPFLTIYNPESNPFTRKNSRPLNDPYLYELDNINQKKDGSLPSLPVKESSNPYYYNKEGHDLPPPPPPTKNPFDDNDNPFENPTGYHGSSMNHEHSSDIPPPPPPPNDFDDGYRSTGGIFLDSKDYHQSEDSGTPHDDESYRMHEMEKQRLRLLHRKPRFHFTKLPYFTIVVTIIQICVFIAELAKMSQLTGSAFQTKPYFNPMLGPSTYLLINMGARYVPCMHQITDITNDTSILFPCANLTSVDTNVCSLPQLCGLLGIPEVNNAYIPHQWYRIITPIFLHAGFLHIIFNLLLQVTMGATIERQIGWLKYSIIYMMCGISGFVLGANFSPDGIASTGALGALFGILAVNMLCFIYCGKKNTNLYGTKKFGLFIVIMILEMIVSFVLGLLPGMDNFSHIGGFAMGLAMGVALLPDPCIVYIDSIIVYDGNSSTMRQFLDNWSPFHDWEHKIPHRVYLWISLRFVALGLAGAYLGALLKNFFITGLAPVNNSCKWCKYINCIPVNGWCDLGNVEVTTSTVSSGNSASATQTPATGTATTDAPDSDSTSNPNEAVVTTTTTLPTNIDNTETRAATTTDNSGGFKKREYEVFEEYKLSNNDYEITKTLSLSDSIVGEQNFGVGIGFYLIIGFITFRFLKNKNWI